MRITLLKATDPDCLTGKLWGEDLLKHAAQLFNGALGLARPQYILEFKDGELQALAEDEEDEAELNRSHQVGISVGLNKAADEVMKWATGSFKLGQDSEASRLRNLSEHLASMGKKAHPGVPE